GGLDLQEPVDRRGGGGRVAVEHERIDLERERALRLPRDRREDLREPEDLAALDDAGRIVDPEERVDDVDAAVLPGNGELHGQAEADVTLGDVAELRILRVVRRDMREVGTREEE